MNTLSRKLATLSLLLLAAPLGAAVPSLINFQGRLTDANDNAVTAATPVTFKLYTVETGGTAAFTESQVVTPDSNGLYNVFIGSTVSLGGLSFDQNLWLEVTVNGETLSPRYRLTASPYALQASSASYAAAVPWSGITGMPAGFADGTDDGAGGGSLTADSVGTSHIIDSTISVNDMGANSVGGNQIIDSTITNADINDVAWGKLTGVPAGFADGVDDTAGGLSADSVGTTHIIDSTITVNDMGANSVGGNQIIDSTITNADISASAAIATSKLSGAVTSIASHGLGGLATLSAVGTSEITDGSVAVGDLNITSVDDVFLTTGTFQEITGTKLFTGTIASNNDTSIVRSGTTGRLKLAAADDTPTSGAGIEFYSTGIGFAKGNISMWTHTGGGSGEFILQTTPDGSAFTERFKVTPTQIRVSESTMVVTGGMVGVGTTPTSAALHVAGPIATAVSGVKTSNYTVTAADSVVLANANSGTFTITLPTASGITGRHYTIKRVDASGNVVTVDGNGAETIDGAATYDITTSSGSVSVVSDGTNWQITNKY